MAININDFNLELWKLLDFYSMADGYYIDCIAPINVPDDIFFNSDSIN